MINDEYLDVLQVAYLLNFKSKRGVQQLVKQGKLNAFKRKNKLFIQVSDVINYAENKLKRYHNYYEYMEVEDKVQYWNSSCYPGKLFGIEDKYVTCAQMAYLLGITPQEVFTAIKKGILPVDILEVNGKTRKVISIKAFMNYAAEKIESFDRLVKYIHSEDKIVFWEGIKNEQI